MELGEGTEESIQRTKIDLYNGTSVGKTWPV